MSERNKSSDSGYQALCLTRSLYQQVTGGHWNAQNVNSFRLFNIADEAVFVFQLVVAQRRRFGSAGFDVRADEMWPVVSQRITDGFFYFIHRRHRARALYSRAARHASEIDISGAGDRRLAAGRLILLIVPTDVDKIPRVVSSDGRQRAEIHP